MNNLIRHPLAPRSIIQYHLSSVC